MNQLGHGLATAAFGIADIIRSAPWASGNSGASIQKSKLLSPRSQSGETF
jgi:hypothetical protein